MLETDAAILASRIRMDFKQLAEPTNWIWSQAPAPKVIDCVMSLRKNYRTTVEPRVKSFVAMNASVYGCSDLRKLIDSSASKSEFYTHHLKMNSEGKAAITSDIVDYLIDAQKRFDGSTEEDRLAAWACWCRPGDYLALEIKGFGLAGFQYLRMLFGADTVKPDVHIIRYVEAALGKPASDVRSVYLLERAGQILGCPIRNIDVSIWNRGSGHGPIS